jgi:hypothetical protein
VAKFSANLRRNLSSEFRGRQSQRTDNCVGFIDNGVSIASLPEQNMAKFPDSRKVEDQKKINQKWVKIVFDFEQ